MSDTGLPTVHRASLVILRANHGEELEKLSDDCEKLTQEDRGLKERVEKLEAALKLDGATPAAPAKESTPTA